MDTDRLRRETRPEHEATEALLPLTGPGLTRAQYIAALERLYTAVRAWENTAASHAPASLRELVASRGRAALLAADLTALHAPLTAATQTRVHHFEQQMRSWFQHIAPGSAAHQAAFLGAMYVVEGSTLGGQLIARHVEPLLHLEPGHGDAFFRGYGDHTGPLWQQFKQHLRDIPDTEADTAIHHARAMFQLFAEALRS